MLRKGLFGGALLAVGGSAAIGLRPTRRGAPPKEKLLLFSEDEYAIFAAIAESIVAVPPGAPSVEEIDVALRADHAMAWALPSVQDEFRQLLHLFENGLSGVATGTGISPFTASSRHARDARLLSWSNSRVSLFRTGYQAVKRLAAACYYSAPASWAALGYSGPPAVVFPAELSS